jgi:molecular chaperone DnaK (HSP70)
VNIGIDLGTTNSALAYIDADDPEDAHFPRIDVLDVPQLVAPDRIETRRTLPSFLLLDDTQLVGVYAREQGALVPTRLVHSAKSWLAHPEVDRLAKILPWDAEGTGRVLSPVEVSSRFLTKFRDEWDRVKEVPLAEQDIVLTVPASFDEEARELTVTAAREAGLTRLTLLEEPSAAFYAWIVTSLSRSREELFDGQVVLVCDVGGGTSDFSLIRVSRNGDDVNFTRTAVGKHLLLGGDNLDLAIARVVESKVGLPLSIRQRSGLRRQCSAAKELLLSEPHQDCVEIAVAGSGSTAIGGTVRSEVTRQELLEIALDGFLPFTERSESPPPHRRALLREFGLPYESDPAITRHLNAFLESTRQRPDAMLFNGGFFIPTMFRERVADVVGRWYNRRPEILQSSDLDSAVAHGAAYYSYIRSTRRGVLVRGGLPRTYYVGLGATDPDVVTTMCLVPRGADEGTNVEISNESLQLVANRSVSFRLYSSLTRTEDDLGQIVEFSRSDPDLHVHAPLHAVIRFGKAADQRLIPVRLEAQLTPIGTLEAWCESKISDHRWRLQFELRKRATDAESEQNVAAVVSEQSLQESLELIASIFASTRQHASVLDELPAKLERSMGLARKSWPLPALRKIADRFLSVADGRKRSPAHESRWLNLAGYCLRPGFGYAGDEFRIEQARRIYAAGLTFGNRVRCEIDWYIFWGRVAGGLNRNQQTQLYQNLSGVLLSAGGKQPKWVNPALLREMWRTACGLELLPVGTKTELGDALVERIKVGHFTDSELWCLSRLGARRLFYGPSNLIVPTDVASRWVDVVLDTAGAGDALARLAQHTHDQTRDLPTPIREAVRRKLEHSPHSARLLAAFEGEQQDDRALGQVFGEELPSGLVLTDTA